MITRHTPLCGPATRLWRRLTRWRSPDTAPRFEPVDPPPDVLAAVSAPPEEEPDAR